MAKKNRLKSKDSTKKKKNLIIWIIGAVSAAVLILLISGNIPFSNSDTKKGKSFLVTGGESRPVLEPSLFTGMTRSAYAAAQNHPEALDQVLCYCYCDEPPTNHTSLLSCFADNHGAG